MIFFHFISGLGRTGVLIACYLVYALRVRANDAIRYVRFKRPNAVQTSAQISVVQEFESFILPQLYVFCNRYNLCSAVVHQLKFDLTQRICERQKEYRIYLRPVFT